MKTKKREQRERENITRPKRRKFIIWNRGILTSYLFLCVRHARLALTNLKLIGNSFRTLRGAVNFSWFGLLLFLFLFLVTYLVPLARACERASVRGRTFLFMRTICCFRNFFRVCVSSIYLFIFDQIVLMLSLLLLLSLHIVLRSVVLCNFVVVFMVFSSLSLSVFFIIFAFLVFDNILFFC